MMRLKSNVRLAGLRPELLMAHLCVQRAFESKGYYCMITSCNDSIHGHGSLHFQGSALDYRTKHLADADKTIVFNVIKDALTDEFDVILEHLGKDNEHIHLEYQPKRAQRH